uniref:Queuine tRNA-ribosyltransferase accessory subunit 2 n=1 Tax=Naja naja TaxID=35670 RepID=A0A8C6VLL6_NAJNA
MKLNLCKIVDGCRLGTLTNLGKKGIQSIEIPGCLLYTKMGSAPHLTHDTLHNIQGMPESVSYCSLQDPAVCSPHGYNSMKAVSIWNNRGRKELTASKFMDIQKAIQPDWFQCLSDGDTISGDNSRKKAKKSVDRSLCFLDECLQLQENCPELKQSLMFGVIEGGDVLEERLRSARETAKRPVAGFLLDAFQGNNMTKETKLELLTSVIAELPEDKPRLIHGIGKPDEVLECIKRGIDIFDSCFPYQVTERYCALSFNYDYQLNAETAGIGLDNLVKDDEKTNDETCSEAQEMTSFEIHLKEIKYQDDFNPIVNGCSCYCCQNHSRAYIHHLIMTKELLAYVLLMMHNFQHYFSFFSSIRNALKEDKLDQLSKIISRQAL